MVVDDPLWHEQPKGEADVKPVFGQMERGQSALVYSSLHDEVWFSDTDRLQMAQWTTEATHLLLYARPGWWTGRCPRVAFGWLHGTPHAFLLDRTWRHGSILQGTPRHTHKHTEAAWLHTLQDRVVQFEAQSTSYLWPLSLFYVHVLGTDIRMNVFVWMDVVQHV